MTGKKVVWTTLVALIFAVCPGFGQTDDTVQEVSQSLKKTEPIAKVENGTQSPITNTQSLFFALDEGQAMQGTDPSGGYKEYDRLWIQKMFFHLTNDVTYQERMRFILSIECALTFSIKQYSAYPATLAPSFSFYPNDVELRYTFGNLDKPWLQISAGYFPFKYNPDAKDLGEYLLRDDAYPNTIITNFEFAMTRELGLHLNGFIGDAAIDQVKWDFMLTSETHNWPLQDWTVSAILSNNLFNFLDLGAGVSLNRFFSVDELKTTPKNNSSQYRNEDGDTSYYTYRATKLMGRGSINPMRFIPEFRLPVPEIFGDRPFFGSQDLKVYAELGILGLQNYTAYDSIVDPVTGLKTWQKQIKSKNYYDSLGDRMPYMIGINLPTNPLISYGILPFILTKWLRDESGDDIRPLAFVTLIPALASGVLDHFLGWNLGLDVLSFEYEWVSQRFPNDNGYAIEPGNSRPIPADEQGRLQGLAAYNLGSPQQAKYALYFKKSFSNDRFAFSGMVARDHMRPVVLADTKKTINDDFLQTNSMWWWTIRLSANF